MASWNEKYEGDQLEECPVCLCNVSKKKRTMHVTRCYETHRHNMDRLNLIRCPLHPLHIIPKKYLNHHLEGNCEEAQNLLRKYFHKNDMKQDFKMPPESFLADVPENILNKSNKRLLFLLRRDLEGNAISDRVIDEMNTTVD